MRRKVSKAVAAVLVAAMAMSMAACGGNSTGGDAGNTADEPQTEGEVSAAGNEQASGGEEAPEVNGDINIGIVVKTAENAHFQDIAYGAVLAGRENGVKVTVQNTTTEADVAGQITMCEDLISSGVKGLILTANDSDGVSTAVEAAHDAGVPFITVDTEINPDSKWENVADYMPVYIGVDHEEMAYQLAKQVMDSMGGEGNIIILQGIMAASSSQERTAGFKRAAEEFEGITVLESEQSGEYSMDKAYEVAKDFATKYDDIDAVFCCNDMMGLGVVNAFKDNGLEIGGENGVKIASIDGSYLALQSIEAGEMYATAYDWSILQGYYAVEQALNLINGGTVENEKIMTPYTVIDSGNISDFMDHGKELDEWQMGTEIEEVSDYMKNFVEMGEGM